MCSGPLCLCERSVLIDNITSKSSFNISDFSSIPAQGGSSRCSGWPTSLPLPSPVPLSLFTFRLFPSCPFLFLFFISLKTARGSGERSPSRQRLWCILCAKDRPWRHLNCPILASLTLISVSYTHLTLPTIYSV